MIPLASIFTSGGSGSGAVATGRQDKPAGDTKKLSARVTRNRLDPGVAVEGTTNVAGDVAEAQVDGITDYPDGLVFGRTTLCDTPECSQDPSKEDDRGQEIDPGGLDEDCELGVGMAGADGISAREGLSGDKEVKEDEASTAPVPKKVCC